MNIPVNFKFNIIKGDKKRMIILRKTPGESLDHILLKLVAYLLFFDDNLLIETKAPQHYKPDLVKFDKEQTWKPVKWIDCGTIDSKKLFKISKHNRQAEIYIFKSSRDSAQALKKKVSKKIKSFSNINYFIFNKENIEAMKFLLENRNKIKILENKIDYSANSAFLCLNFNNQTLQLNFEYVM